MANDAVRKRLCSGGGAASVEVKTKLGGRIAQATILGASVGGEEESARPDTLLPLGRNTPNLDAILPTPSSQARAAQVLETPCAGIAPKGRSIVFINFKTIAMTKTDS